MLKLHVIGSGSSGNAYILRCNDEALLIECGAGNYKEYLRAAGGANIVGCILSHCHADHCNPRNLKDIASVFGCPIISNKEVADAYPKEVAGLEPKKRHEIYGSSFKVMALPVMHGYTECYAYVIDTTEGRLVFATDLVNFPYHIKGCNYLCIECNYSQLIRNAKIADNEDIFSQSQNHMELNTCVACVERHISPDLSHVVLLHLSSGLSDKNAFIGRIKQCCEDKDFPFVNIDVADKNKTIILNEIPF